jgi:hypothetical protein
MEQSCAAGVRLVATTLDAAFGERVRENTLKRQWHRLKDEEEERREQEGASREALDKCWNSIRSWSDVPTDLRTFVITE